MANTNAPEAKAPETQPLTSTATPTGAPAVVSAPERVQAAVNEDFLKALSKTDQKDLTKAIRNVIPRDSKGKALAHAELDPAVLATESDEPEPVAAPVPEPVPVVAETVEPTPEETPEPTAIEPTPEETPVELEPDPDDLETPSEKKLVQQRLRAANEVDDMALTIYRKAIALKKPISLAQAEVQAKIALGIKDVAASDAPASKTVDVAQAELAELRNKRKEAKAAYDVDAEDAATTAIEDKLQEIADLKEDHRARQQAETHQRQTAWQASEAQAVNLYPDVIPDKVKGLSAQGKLLLAAKDRLYEEHKASNDPIRFRTDYPLMLLKLAAAEEGIAPSTVKAKPVPAPKVASTRSVTPAKPAPPLASASARTTPNGTSAPNVATLLGTLSQRELKEINKNLRPLVRS